jgi:hypothetical protein
MANDRAARERQQDQQRADAAAQAQRDHDRNMAQLQHQNAVAIQNMQAAENQKGRDFQKKQSAKERASQYSTANMRKPTDMTADHTGGAGKHMEGKFGNNAYKSSGKFDKQYDFSKKK